MIRPFQLGDLYLLQRLHRQATRFDTVQTLADAPSPFLGALSSVASCATGRSTPTSSVEPRPRAGAGWLFAGAAPPESPGSRYPLPGAPVGGDQRPSGHLDQAALLLSPRTPAPSRRAALLRCCTAAAVDTLCSVGFQIYSRQTIWRLPTGPEDFSHLVASPVRPAGEGDHWALTRLYELSTPDAVQQAEGYVPGDPERRPPLLTGDGDHWQTYVATRAGEVTGAVQVRPGRHGFWLHLWCNWLEPDSSWRQELLRHGLSLIRGYGARVPVYLAVADHHGALDAVLGDHGFAPFTDRVSLVKHVMRWLREPVAAPCPR